jgi:hypothetical protein
MAAGLSFSRTGCQTPDGERSCSQAARMTHYKFLGRAAAS